MIFTKLTNLHCKNQEKEEKWERVKKRERERERERERDNAKNPRKVLCRN
jgi:hypothetical protein